MYHFQYFLFSANDTVAAKMLAYNRANRAVAILCNHQRAAPKNFEQQMLRLQDKVRCSRVLGAASGLPSGRVFCVIVSIGQALPYTDS